ncbi:MAG TPA: putative toxin-antitoxin system toxin component, PIN family [Thermoanaerobaculia bacterium]|nr:putative toxin-antitoxin system toxin component, PIN family [Thermoanaerobaculia bacterium]
MPDTVATPDCRDPDDRKFLALAIAGAADALVTGDDDLLSVEVEAFRIESPAALREERSLSPREPRPRTAAASRAPERIRLR